MPTVPQYKREVNPEVTHTPKMWADVNSDMFGGNVAKALGNVGDAIGNFGDTLAAIRERVDDTKILELSNYSAEWEKENLTDTKKGYLYTVGKDAYGKSESIIKDYETYMNDYISKANLSPHGRRRALETYGKLRDRVNKVVTAHDVEQGMEWAKNEADMAKTNYLNNAINMRNSGEEMGKALLSGYQVIEWQGEIGRWDEATIRAEKMKYRASAVEGVLNAYLQEGSLKASEFFEENKKYISPTSLPKFAAAVKQNELNYTARNKAASLVGLPLEQAYGEINSISDTQTREATMREFSHLTSQAEAVQREQNQKFMSDVSNRIADALANGQDANDIKREILQSDLPFDAKQKQIDYINECLELNQEVHLWNETEYIENLKRTDHEAFQQLDLSKFALTKSERQKYLEEQNKPIEYSTSDQLRDMVKEFDTFFMAGKNSLSGKEYKEELIGLLARIERLQGKAFDIKNIDEGSLKALIEGFDYKADAMPDDLKTFGIKNFKNLDETKEMYMRAKAVADVQEGVARGYMRFKSQYKREPEPAEMYGIVQQEYMRVARERQQKAQSKVNQKIDIINGIKQTQVKKKGYTKVLTHFEEKTIPNLEKETGVKMNITSTYRADGKYGHEKGLKADVFPANPTKENILKSAEYLISCPDVEVIFTSHPDVLRRFGANKKVQNATSYDNKPEVKKAGINHMNHFDITLSKNLGGIEQNI